MKILASAVAVATVGLVLLASPAFAQNATDNMEVSLTIAPSCTIEVVPLDFGTLGTLNAVGSPIQDTATITVTCTSDAAYAVGLGLGSNALTTQRRLFNAAAGADHPYVNYDLYSENTYTTAWGTTEPTDTLAGTGSGSGQDLTVYGAIPAGQAVSVGSYSDTVTATVWYGTDL